MAALLDIVHLRRHALPAHFNVTRLPSTAHTPVRATTPPVCRPRLVATWHKAASGIVRCFWSLDSGDPASR